MNKIPLLVTHSGRFHADDVMAYAMLRLALGLQAEGEDHKLVRTRSVDTIADADVVWDVGFEYDAGAMRFDHHQRGHAQRPDGVPYSAAGLVWKSLHSAICLRVLGEYSSEVATRFDEDVVRIIDLQDNGLISSSDTMDFRNIIEDFNATWNGKENPDAQFLFATEFADAFIHNRLRRLASLHAAATLVQVALNTSENPRILELPRSLPWQEAVRNMAAVDVAYAVFPAGARSWAIDAMPPDGDAFGQKVPLPATWGGLEKTELQKVCGVRDAIFVHAKLFCGSAETREGAMEMAQRSLDLHDALANESHQCPGGAEAAAKALMDVIE